MKALGYLFAVLGIIAFIGTEISPNYVEYANNRIGIKSSEYTLF